MNRVQRVLAVVLTVLPFAAQGAIVFNDGDFTN